jgi:FkbM family methyltransferase
MRNMFDKIYVHIKDFAYAKDLAFMFYRILQVLKRRGVPVPEVLSLNIYECYGTEKHLMDYVVPSRGCFIDVGANVGMWTRFIAKKGYVVHAFEPDPRAYKQLKELAKSFPNVNVYPNALGEYNSEAKLNIHESSGHDSFVFQGEDFIGRYKTVPIRTLDSFNLKNVGLIKIDTEGYEVPILKGAERTIKENKPRLIIEVHNVLSIKKEMGKITKILAKHGYRWVIRYKDKVRKYFPQPHIITI